jgi:hypothetical protein
MRIAQAFWTDGDAGDVSLPTYSHGDFAGLSAVEGEHARIWRESGYAVPQLGSFMRSQGIPGVLHWIKKYLVR